MNILERVLRGVHDWTGRRLGLEPRPAASYPPETPVLPAGGRRNPRLGRRRSPYLAVMPEEWTRWTK